MPRRLFLFPGTMGKGRSEKEKVRIRKWPAQTKALTLLSHFGLLLLQCRQRKRNLAIQEKTPPNALSRDPFRQQGVISWFDNKAYWTPVKAANYENRWLQRPEKPETRNS